MIPPKQTPRVTKSDLHKYLDACSDARVLVDAAYDPDAEPLSDAIDKAIRLAVERDGIEQLSISIEAATKVHPCVKRCVTDLIAKWLYETDTQGRTKV